PEPAPRAWRTGGSISRPEGPPKYLNCSGMRWVRVTEMLTTAGVTDSSMGASDGIRLSANGRASADDIEGSTAAEHIMTALAIRLRSGNLLKRVFMNPTSW